jgi:tetratricopeptide (TPR) repeat protein
LKCLDADHDNVRAVLEYLTAREDYKRALEIANGVWRFWTARGHHVEGRKWFRRLLANRDGLSDQLRAEALNACGTLAHGSCALDEAYADLNQALELYRRSEDTHGAGIVLNNLAWIAMELGELDRAKGLSDEAHRLHIEAGDERGIAVALNNLAWIANYRCEFDAAVSLHLESIGHRRRASDARGVAFSLTNLAWTEQRRCRYEQAAEYVAEACAMLDEIRDELLCSWAWQMRAAIAYDNGDFRYAVDQIERAMPTWHRVGNISGLLYGYVYLVLSWLKLGETGRAEELLRSAEAAALAMPHKWGMALLLIGRARLLAATGNTVEAVRLSEEAAQVLGPLGELRGVAEAHELCAQLLCGMDPERARKRLLAADECRRRIGAPVPLCERPVVEKVRRALSL